MYSSFSEILKSGTSLNHSATPGEAQDQLGPRLVVNSAAELSRMFARSLGRTYWKGLMRCEIPPRAGWQIDLSLCELWQRYEDPIGGRF